MKECYAKVESEDVGRRSTAQDILRESSDFLRSVIAPVGGVEGVTLSYVCPHCRCFPLEGYMWWVSSGRGDGNNRKNKQCNWLCAACGGQFDYRAPNMVLVIQNCVEYSRSESFSSTRCTARYV